MANQSTCAVCGALAPNDIDACSIECFEYEHSGEDPKALFKAIVKHVELQKAVREYDNSDHDGTGIPGQQQVADAVSILAKGRELRRLMKGKE